MSYRTALLRLVPLLAALCAGNAPGARFRGTVVTMCRTADGQWKGGTE